MRSKFIAAATNAALVISLLGASGAGAATEVGNGCTANVSGAGVPVNLANAPGSPLPATMPSNGVITSWRLSIIPIPPELNATETLKIFRPAGGTGQFQVVGESAPLVLNSGANSQLTRIPVAAGDHVGGSLTVSGETGGLFCNTENAGDRVGLFASNPPNGSTATLAGELAGYQVPIVVSLEADADNDGFGDETQDACPQSATTQVACPVVTLSASATATKRLVTVVLTGTSPATVTVNGKVSLGKSRKANLKGGTKAVTPGAFTKFKLKFPAKLIKRLKELPPSKKLTLKITSTAPNLAAAPTKKVIKAKLKGQGPQS